jgi:hypothetical protein
VALRGRGPQQGRQENKLVEKDSTTVETIEKDNTRDTGHDEGGVNIDTQEKLKILCSQEMECARDEPAMHQWSAVNEEIGMEEDTREGREEQEGSEGMTQGNMEIGVDRGDVEEPGISEVKDKDVMEGREKETGLRMGGQLE